jgi:DNA (cytosine-5)-methyltransferase 1
MTVGSLFSGIGGIDIAFQQAGFKISWAIEKDAACCRTYRHNFNDTQLVESDIRFVDPLMLSAVDVITAGFPCQPFSIAGKQRGFDDERGHLFYEVGKFINAYKPRFVFLENVPNLMEHNEGKTFLVVHNVLADLNYSIRYRVLRASEYGGVPQIRDRIYIIAFREQEDCDRFEFPDKLDLSMTIENVLYRKRKKHDIYYYPPEDPFYQRASKIVTRYDSIYRVYHDSIKVTQNHMCPTLTASMGIGRNQVPLIADDYGLRKLTLRECLDFQGFPTGYYFPSSVTINDAYKQCGNSVVVSVIRRIAEKIKETME